MNTADYEKDLKDWVEQQVDAVSPDLGIWRDSTEGTPYLKFMLGMVANGTDEISEVVDGFKSSFKQYRDTFQGGTKLTWRSYPSVKLELAHGGKIKITISARLVIEDLDSGG